MNFNEKSRNLSKALFDVVNSSGLPMFACELHVRLLLNAIQNTMRQEDELEAQKEKTQEAKVATEEIKPDVEKD